MVAQSLGNKVVASPARSERRVGKYRLIAQLGEGGMARVSLAYTRGMGGFVKLVVIKSMKENLTDPLFTKSFIHEARLAAQLTHPNIVQTYEVGDERGVYYIAMEYIEGQTLRAVTRRMAPERMPLAVQLRILIEVARALHYSHNATSFDGTPLGIVHRDVSPQNIVLTYTGQVKLLDFGIAKASSNDELTREGMVKGKIDYMAPEQLRGEAIDRRADIFALGVMLWEAASGRRFSGGAEVAEVTKMHNRVMGTEARLRDVAPATPMRVVEVCERALALDPADRYTTAEEFAEDLANYLADTTRNTDARQLAEIVQPLFKEDQERIHRTIEESLREVRANLDDTDESSDEWDPDSSLPQLTQASWSDSQSDDGSMVDIAVLDSRLSARASGPADARRVNTLLALLVAALVVGAGAALLLPTGRLPEEGSEPNATATLAPTDPIPAPAARRAEIRINVVPVTATTELDGTPIVLPFHASLAADGALHRVTATAEGYQTEERSFTFDEDLELTLTLQPAAVANSPVAETGGRRARRGREAQASSDTTMAAATSSGASAAGTSPRPEVTPPTTAEPRGPSRPAIVSADPYAP